MPGPISKPSLPSPLASSTAVSARMRDRSQPRRAAAASTPSSAARTSGRDDQRLSRAVGGRAARRRRRRGRRDERERPAVDGNPRSSAQPLARDRRRRAPARSASCRRARRPRARRALRARRCRRRRGATASARRCAQQRRRLVGEPLAIDRRGEIGVGDLDDSDQVETGLHEPLGGRVHREPRGGDAARALPQHFDRPAQRGFELLGPDRKQQRQTGLRSRPASRRSARAKPRSLTLTWKSALFQSASATASSGVSPSSSRMPAGVRGPRAADAGPAPVRAARRRAES